MTFMHYTCIYNEWVSLHSEGLYQQILIRNCVYSLQNMTPCMWILRRSKIIPGQITQCEEAYKSVMKRDVWKSNQINCLSPIIGDSPEKNSNYIYMTTLCIMLWGKSSLFYNARENNNGRFVYFLTQGIIVLNGRF